MDCLPAMWSNVLLVFTEVSFFLIQIYIMANLQLSDRNAWWDTQTPEKAIESYYSAQSSKIPDIKRVRLVQMVSLLAESSSLQHAIVYPKNSLIPLYPVEKRLYILEKREVLRSLVVTLVKDLKLKHKFLYYDYDSFTLNVVDSLTAGPLKGFEKDLSVVPFLLSELCSEKMEISPWLIEPLLQLIMHFTL